MMQRSIPTITNFMSYYLNKDTISRKMNDRKIPKENEQKDKHELQNITQFKMNLTKNRG
jgi:hypothetical protein